MKIRTRFAPSPTGDLHIGGARTALFSYLFAQHHKGDFILRIEDTDRERSTEASINVILDAMKWLNLSYEEGPFYQTKRLDRYKEVLEQLAKEGHAYRCYCSKERLEVLREQQLANKEKPRYDGLCRELTQAPQANAPFIWRFKNPQTGSVQFDDLVRGPIEVQNEELDDLVILRQDGVPTYNFAVVVDDWDMQISHVIRGDDHINNTPRQINIYKALNAPIPQFAHVPMILGSDGKRLSKRHGALNVLEYKEIGVLPEALLNYLVRLGWSNGDQEIFSMKEMIKLFNLESINRAPAAFDMDKLLWINQQYLKNTDPAELAVLLKPHMEKLGVNLENGPDLADIAIALRERVKTLEEMAQKSIVWFQPEVEYQEEAVNQHLSGKADEVLAVAETSLAELEVWQPETIKHALVEICDALNLKMGKVGPAIRVAITGSTDSPSLDVTMWLLGKEKTLRRIERAKDLYFP
jgi:glutamyl-tRNA synthetase